jgi:pimeloyl-ACP methyl ester carboxylesterase
MRRTISIQTKLLYVKVIQGGPKDGTPVLLFHGWPDNATTWHRISTHLHEAGLRTIAPMRRGFDGTRFLSDRTRRTGIEIARFYWYHWFQVTKRGAEAVARDTKSFARIMWDTWSPLGCFDEETVLAAPFANPDWAAVTNHSSRLRWEIAFDPRSIKVGPKVKATKRLKTPTIFFHGALDGVTPARMTEKMSEKFVGPFERIVLNAWDTFRRANPELIGKKPVDHFSVRT